MKKIFISIMALTLCCAMLCACGSRDMGIDTPMATNSPAATVSPDPRDEVPMPDNSVGDGNVNDRDGIIDDEDSTGGIDDITGMNGTTGNGGIVDNNTASGNTAVTSPIPTATVNP